MSQTKRRRGNGEGSIHRRPDGRWEARFDVGLVDGRRRRASVYGRTRREVQEKLRQRQTEFESSGTVLDQSMTVANWLDHWVSVILPMRVANGTLAQSTFNNYCDWVHKHINPTLGNMRLAKLSPSDVDALISSKRERFGSNSLRLIRATLRKALTDAQRQGLVIRNVAALSEPVRVVKQAQKWLSEDEARTLLNQVRKDRLEALYVVCLSTGLRRGEALALSWDDIDLDQRTLLVRRAIKRVQTQDPSGPRTRLELGPTKTHSSVRTQLLPQVCIEALKRHRLRQNIEKLANAQWDCPELVFTTPTGTPIDPANFAKRLSDHCIAAGLGHRYPHQLRHSAATLLLAQNVPLHEVSEILGHSSVSVTKDVYGHLTSERRRAAADAMDRILTDPDHRHSKSS